MVVRKEVSKAVKKSVSKNDLIMITGDMYHELMADAQNQFATLEGYIKACKKEKGYKLDNKQVAVVLKALDYARTLLDYTILHAEARAINKITKDSDDVILRMLDEHLSSALRAFDDYYQDSADDALKMVGSICDSMIYEIGGK